MRRVAINALLVLAFAASSITAQRQRTAAGAVAKSGAIEGDVYLQMKNGDTKRGVGQQVLLLRSTFPLRDSILSMCRRSASNVAHLENWYLALRRDSEAIARRGLPGAPSTYDVVAREVRVKFGIASASSESHFAARRLVAEAVVDSTSTSMSARYSFEKVLPGEYVLYSTWNIADVDYVWLVPVTVTSGGSAKRDLNNSVVVSGEVMCPPAPKFDFR